MAPKVEVEEKDPVNYVRTESWEGSKGFIKDVKVNGIDWRDTVFQVILVKESMLREEDKLPGKSLNSLVSLWLNSL